MIRGQKDGPSKTLLNVIDSYYGRVFQIIGKVSENLQKNDSCFI